MSNSHFRTYLISNLDITEGELSTLLENYSSITYKKDDFLLRENEHCNNTFFVEEGLLRQYSISNNGKEHTISFGPENWFVTDRESMNFDKPSSFNIQALEDSKVAALDDHFINLLSDKIPSFTSFNNKLLHNHIRQLQHRINLLLGASAEERYLEFVAMYPNILLRVPQIMVASYLGITPESLSRVRKELARKNFKK